MKDLNLITLPQLVSTAQVCFPTSFWPQQLDGSKLRSKLIRLIKENEHLSRDIGMDPLHNHIQKDLSVVYYRVINEVACLGAIANGTSSIKQFLATFFELFAEDKGYQQFYEFDYQERFERIGYVQTPIFYCLNNWLPFSKRDGVDFRKEYIHCSNEQERRELLRTLLKDQILSLLRRLSYDAVYQLDIEMDTPNAIVPVTIPKKDVTLRFSMLKRQHFSLNFSLPSQVGFGEHTSIGYGHCTTRSYQSDR